MDLVKDYGIIGICSSYGSTLIKEGKVAELPIKNMTQALKMVSLDESIMNKEINDLTLSEKFKLELATKLQDNIIIIGNMANTLNYKDQEYIKKLLIKLNSDYNKKVIVIDNDIKVFFNLVKRIYVIQDKKILYETSNFFDDGLYKYMNMPKIVEFIKYVNKDKKYLKETIDIYELIKDIYRSVS